MLDSMLTIWRDEWSKFYHQHHWLFIIWGVLPPILAFVIMAIFSNHTPTHLPIAFIDEDQSSLSRDFRFMTSASPSLAITEELTSLREAKEKLNNAEIFAVFVIPHDFERNIQRGVSQNITLYYNTQFMLIGKAINAAFTEIEANFNAQNLIAQNLVKTSNFSIAAGYSLPILPQINAFYNKDSNYAQFLGTLILPCLWQILVALGMLELLKTPVTSLKDALQRLGINTACALMWSWIMIDFFKALGFPILGSWFILMLAFFAICTAISGVVFFLQSILRDSIKTLSAVAVYTAPSLAFAGITFPQNSMSAFATFWSHILPISHFMQIYLEQSSYDIPIGYSLEKLAGMLPFGLFLCLGIAIYLIFPARKKERS